MATDHMMEGFSSKKERYSLFAKMNYLKNLYTVHAWLSDSFTINLLPSYDISKMFMRPQDRTNRAEAAGYLAT